MEQGVACIMALSQVGYQCSFAKVTWRMLNLPNSLGIVQQSFKGFERTF
jgi:hypothetical protein